MRKTFDILFQVESWYQILSHSKMDFGMSMKDMVRLLTHAQNYTLFFMQVIKTVPQNLVLIPAFSEHHLMSTEDNQKIHNLVRFCQACSSTLHLKQFIWSELSRERVEDNSLKM